MRMGFYPKLALDGIRKNKRMYFPYILTCIGMVMMTYIINYLKMADAIAALNGGRTIREFMKIGMSIMVFFSAIFLFYTNSFLIRRRKKEFGLYNILGMSKINIGIILFWESVFVGMVSIFMGFLFGFAFSKLAELGLVNMLNGKISYTLSVPVQGVINLVVPFLTIFFLIFLNSLRQVWFSNAISLLRSENVGEKPPRANWLLGILGMVVLGAAYYLAVTIKDPLSAIGVFFVAVILVIAATYLIMIAGSVLFCRILQKKKSYYYDPRHFVSVSQMVYRMKKNGAGLASICILATMVLVMISSTSALFIGMESVIKNRYPKEINMWFRMYDNRVMTEEDAAVYEERIGDILDEYNASTDNIVKYGTVSLAGVLNDGDVIYDTDDIYNFNIGSASDVIQIYLISIEDYNAIYGQNVTLASDEALLYTYRNDYSGDTFGFYNGKHFTIKEHLKECFAYCEVSIDIVPSFILIVPDIKKALEGVKSSSGKELTYSKWVYCFDTSLGADEDIELSEKLYAAFRDMQLNGYNNFSYSIESRERERAGFYAVYGGLFYLGIILSIVFIIAAVLIIYYKQISEGYEDEARFEIMQKVGMTKKDIRKSINAQILTVFFMPLIGAGLHLAFAFPIIEKLLLLFNLNNRKLFIGTTVGSFLIFALFYMVVYKITAGAYYQIVSGTKE